MYIKDDCLCIEGERKNETISEAEGGINIQEKSYGLFKRRVALPRDVVQDSIQAKMKDGVLHLTLDKQEGAGAEVQSIEIE